MIRAIAAMFVGLATAMLVVTVVSALGRTVYPLPEGLDMADAEAVADYFRTIPVGALVISMVSWWLGVMAGGLGACSMAKENPIFFCLVIGGAILALVVKALNAFDYPSWFGPTSVLGILAAMATSVAIAKRLGFNNPTQSPFSKDA